MLLIPAIDLKDGRCVRLRQGDMNDVTVFSDDPAEMAARWAELGASRIHIVDLNGARSGKPVNETAIRRIIETVGPDVEVQLGGGLRDLDTIERYIDDGVNFVVIGTAAVKNPGFLKDACSAFGGHVIVALDAKDGKVATDGWSKLTGHDVIDLAAKFEDYGVDAILYTDIGRDGMLMGVNIDATVALARAVSIPVLASGGIAGIDDIRRLVAVQHEGVSGAILGRALYEGQLDFKEAVACVAQAAAG
jgi:phosphoribosylformimino-5-aminoimidazole carboxamide ribotide isomerase